MKENKVIIGDDVNLTLRNTQTNISIADAFVLSLNLYGNIDMKYISKKTNKSLQEIIDNLKGSIFLNPDKFNGDMSKGWETKDEYLSGDLLKKWKTAQEANKKYNNLFQENLSAIKGLGKKIIPFENIYITLGTPWVPEKIIKQFIIYLLDINSKYSHLKIVSYYKEFNEWKIDKGLLNFIGNYAKNTKVFGTQKIRAIEIIEHTLNMKSIRIKDKIYNSETKKEKSVFNEEETILALKKQEDIISEFRKWIASDEKIMLELREIYSQKFALFQKRNYDGSFLLCPNLNKDIRLMDYQKNAIARILFSPNTLLAHDVGAGKTYIMIIAGMELRRLGISQKNVYVVPNNLVGQWKNMFLLLYQNANVLTIEPKDFTKDKLL